MKRATLAIAAFGFVLTGSIPDGAPQEKAPPSGDIEAGKAVASTCATCHGADGISRMPAEVPHLAGQHARYIVQTLAAYKKGERKDEIMQDVAARLSEEDMVNVAAYFASLRPFKYAAGGAREAAPAGPAEEDPFAAVREATAECAGCHGEDGNSDLPGTPSLAGQHVKYLIAALKAYRDGARTEETMQAFAEPLGNADIEDMAYFYAAMEPRRTETPVAGDPYAGMAVTAPCAGCHGEDGNGKDPKTPRLAGLDPEYLEAAVKAYKDGTRDHAVMRDAVAALRQVDIKDLSAYYATREPKALPIRKPLTTRQWVERCDRCHGPEGNSTDPRFPVLAGQSEPYLVKTLKLYHMGERENPFMYAMSFPMGESDIKKLAAYYASRTGN
ncbi:MAG: c-type cytochrome [Kiloniellaceae bacterium]